MQELTKLGTHIGCIWESLWFAMTKGKPTRWKERVSEWADKPRTLHTGEDVNDGDIWLGDVTAAMNGPAAPATCNYMIKINNKQFNYKNLSSVLPSQQQDFEVILALLRRSLQDHLKHIKAEQSIRLCKSGSSLYVSA